MEQPLYWELQVLKRAVAYPNLSAASRHVGLSQPQLSRIVSRLESALEIVLLNRSVRRQSGWTPLAHRLALAFSKADRHFQHEIARAVDGTPIRHYRIAALAGLTGVAMRLARRLFVDFKASVVELDIHDLDRLEELMLKGAYDFIFTSREPARRKFRYKQVIGYQSLETIVEGSAETQIVSSYQFASKHARSPVINSSLLVSNSLHLRRSWLRRFGGRATLPSPVRAARAEKADVEVLLLGSEDLSSRVWEKAAGYFSETTAPNIHKTTAPPKPEPESAPTL